MATIDFIKGTNKVSVSVNGAARRNLYNPNNLVVKPLEAGAVLKLSDESWRKHVFLTDVVTEGGVPKSPFADVPALVTYLISLF